jgi:hypothetical protein
VAPRKTYNEILLEEAGLAHHYDPTPSARPASTTAPTSIVAEPSRPSQAAKIDRARQAMTQQPDAVFRTIFGGRARQTVVLRYQGTELVVGPPPDDPPSDDQAPDDQAPDVQGRPPEMPPA